MIAQEGQTALAVFWGNCKPETMHGIKVLLESCRLYALQIPSNSSRDKGSSAKEVNSSDSHSSGYLRKTLLKSRQHVGT